jgi:hypothetical protein
MSEPNHTTPSEPVTVPRTALVTRTQRAIGALPDTRSLKRELRSGNPYALAWIERRGARFDAASGAIVAREVV